MTEVGTVVAIKKKYAVVKVNRHAGCENCNICGLGKKKDSIELELINEANAQVNDVVEISMSSVQVVRVMSIIYLIPIILATIGLIIAMKLNLSDIWQLVITLSALLVSVLLIYLSDKLFKKKNIMPKVVKIISKGESA